MDQKQTRSRALVLLIAAISVLPMVLAWAISQNPGWLSSKTNNGRLISPAMPIEHQQWQGIDEFSRQHIAELKGHWVLLNIIPNDHCNQICLAAVHKTRQIRLMLNKDLIRVRRAVAILTPVDTQIMQSWWSDEDRLLRVSVAAQLNQKIKKIMGTPIQEGVILIMDPLGNLMMVYDAGFDPYLIQKDLKKLLRVSQIG